MDLVFNKIMMLIDEFQTQAYVLLVILFIVIGVTFCFSTEGTEKLKKRGPYIVIGFLLMVGAVTLGAKYGNSLKF